MRTLLLVALLAYGTQEHLAPVAAPLTEVEALRVQNLNLERAILERQVADWTAKQSALKTAIEAARPGFAWDPETGKFTAKEVSK